MENPDPNTFEIILTAIREFGYWASFGGALLLLVSFYAVKRILLPPFDAIGAALARGINHLLPEAMSSEIPKELPSNNKKLTNENLQKDRVTVDAD